MRDVVIVNGFPWPKDLVRQFKRTYERALKDGKPVFQFQGQDILVKYAQYLIEFAEKELGEEL